MCNAYREQVGVFALFLHILASELLLGSHEGAAPRRLYASGTAPYRPKLHHADTLRDPRTHHSHLYSGTTLRPSSDGSLPLSFPGKTLESQTNLGHKSLSGFSKTLRAVWSLALLVGTSVIAFQHVPLPR